MNVMLSSLLNEVESIWLLQSDLYHLRLIFRLSISASNDWNGCMLENSGWILNFCATFLYLNFK